MKIYATTDDIVSLGKNLSQSQAEICDKLLETASAKLRVIAKKYSKDIDQMIDRQGEDFALAVKQTVIQATVRALESLSNSPLITQGSQSAMGYSVSMTYLNAGQSVYFMRNELKDLSILRQTYGALEVY